MSRRFRLPGTVALLNAVIVACTTKIKEIEESKNIPYKSTTHEERFFHFRPDCDPGIEEYRGADGTVYFRQIDKDANIWIGTAAVLSPNDTFNRKIGRQVARARYFFPEGKVNTTSRIEGANPTWADALDCLCATDAAIAKRK